MSIHDTTQTLDPAPQHNPEPKRSQATKPIMMIIAVLDALALLGVALTAVFSSAIGFTRRASTVTADTTGATGVNVEANASEFNLGFGSVSEATLQTDGVNADTLAVTPRRRRALSHRPRSVVQLVLLQLQLPRKIV